jgi:hypothetical protein
MLSAHKAHTKRTPRAKKGNTIQSTSSSYPLQALARHSLAKIALSISAIVFTPLAQAETGTLAETESSIFGIEALAVPQTASPPLPQGPWYQVELYIFRQQASGTNELWPLKTPLDFTGVPNLMTVDTVPMTEILPGDNPVAFQQVPMNAIETYDLGQRLIESRSYEMLYKASWRQPFVSQQEAPTVYISGGDTQAADQRELEGTLRFHKGRYLHVDAHLTLGKYEANFQEIRPAEPDALSAAGITTNEYASNDTPLITPNVVALEMFELKESRRMRSGELHYLDHPKFGMLIQINRIKEDQG